MLIKNMIEIYLGLDFFRWGQFGILFQKCRIGPKSILHLNIFSCILVWIFYEICWFSMDCSSILRFLMNFMDFLRVLFIFNFYFSWVLRIPMIFTFFRQGFKIVVMFCLCVLRHWFRHRWKTENQGFPTVKKSTSEDTYLKTYGDSENPTKTTKLLYFTHTSTKIHKIEQKS